MNIVDMPLSTNATVSSNDAIADIKSLQSYALLNRLDIRAGLARYEAAESGLRLEIAKQYPDFVLSPSYVFEQGDRIWTLGLNSLLTVLNRNRGLIAEATALREVEAAQFYALQTRVIRQIEMQQSTVLSVQENVKRAEQVLQVQSQRFKQTQRQFETGIADRLELTGGQLELVIAQQNRLNLSYQLQAALIELEDGLQRPIQGLFKLPDTLQNSDTVKNKG
jgi:outer membrane protein TolC